MQLVGRASADIWCSPNCHDNGGEGINKGAHAARLGVKRTGGHGRSEAGGANCRGRGERGGGQSQHWECCSSLQRIFPESLAGANDGARALRAFLQIPRGCTAAIPAHRQLLGGWPGCSPPAHRPEFFSLPSSLPVFLRLWSLAGDDGDDGDGLDAVVSCPACPVPMLPRAGPHLSRPPVSRCDSLVGASGASG